MSLSLRVRSDADEEFLKVENEMDDLGGDGIRPFPPLRRTAEARLRPLVLRVGLDRLSAPHRGHGYDVSAQNSTGCLLRPQLFRLLVYGFAGDAWVFNVGVPIRKAPALCLSFRGRKCPNFGSIEQFLQFSRHVKNPFVLCCAPLRKHNITQNFVLRCALLPVWGLAAKADFRSPRLAEVVGKAGARARSRSSTRRTRRFQGGRVWATVCRGI